MSIDPDSNEAIERVRSLMESSGFTEATDSGIILHQMYETLRIGGFTERQALWIISIGLFGVSGSEEAPSDAD